MSRSHSHVFLRDDPDENWLLEALEARSEERRADPSPAAVLIRATHRADPTPGSPRPALYACREADLVAALETTRAGEPHTLSVHDARTGWRAWRPYP